MRTLLLVLWSGACVAAGVVLSSVEFGGKTPVQQAQGVWKQQSPRLEGVKTDATTLIDEVKKKVTRDDTPTERHAPSERDAVNRLIAKRQH